MAGTARLDPAARRTVFRAPLDGEGFVSRWHRVPTGHRLHIRQREVPGPGPLPCVLLHGLAVSHRYLMPTARCLTGRTVLVPDLPGFGFSDRPAGVQDPDRQAEVVGAWLAGRGGGPVCLVGHSYGAQVAAALAWRRPELVGALVLIGPTVDPTGRGVAGLLLRWLRDLRWEDWRQVSILLADLRDAGPRRVAGTLRRAVRDRIDRRLPDVAVPVLLVRGARDPIAPAGWLTALRTVLGSDGVEVDRARVSGAEVDPARVPGTVGIAGSAGTVTIAGAAHNVATTAGAEVAAAIEEFLTAVEQSGQVGTAAGRRRRWGAVRRYRIR